MDGMWPEQRVLTLGDLEALEISEPPREEAAAPNWWDPDGEGLCVWAAYQPKGAASLAASYLDLTGNGNNAFLGVSPSWNTVDGWIFNGSTQYLRTGFVPQNDQSQSAIVQYTNWSPGANGYLWGEKYYTDACFHFNGDEIGTKFLRWANGQIALQVVNPFPSNGNSAIAGDRGYLDGVDQGIAIPGFGRTTTWDVWIGAANNVGSPWYPSIVRVQAFALYDCTLIEPQVLAVATAMAVL